MEPVTAMATQKSLNRKPWKTRKKLGSRNRKKNKCTEILSDKQNCT